jgi:hypothetical protein
VPKVIDSDFVGCTICWWSKYKFGRKIKIPWDHIKSNLSWKTLVQNICRKAFKTLGFIRRTKGRSSNERVKERCYFALVRPHIEYSARIWDPEQKDLIKELDNIQRKAASFVKNCFD